MIDLWEFITAEAQPVTWKSKAIDGDYDENGEWVGPSVVETGIQAVVQPATGNQLKDLPEGIRTEAQYLIWAKQDLQEDDEIIHSGVTYRVMYLWPRSAEGGFTRAAMGRKRD